MKFFVSFVVVFMTVLLTNSAEINAPKYKSNKECKTVSLEADYYEKKEGEGKIENFFEESPCQGNDPSQCPIIENRVVSSLASNQPELEILENIPVAPKYFYGLRPLQRSFDWNGQWQTIDNLPKLSNAPYSGVQYYAHSPLYATYSPSSTYLPPAVPTYARRSIPELHSQIYRRPARVIRSRGEEDFMAELRHMAMMNNILPTMPIPFLRSSSYGNVPYEASSVGGAAAVFPVRAPNCALPLLFSCSPKISRGNLAKPLPSDYSRNQILNKPFEVKNKSGSSQSEGTSESLGLTVGHENGNYMKKSAMNAIDKAVKPKHVGNENAISDKKHAEGTLPAAHVTS